MLTANDIALVRISFAKILPIRGTVAELFYGRLFEIAPQLRPLFPQDLKGQKTFLMAIMAVSVATLVPHVNEGGIRPAGDEVAAAHYAIVAEALMWTLNRALGNAFTPEVRSAWTKVYGVLDGTMKADPLDMADAA